MPSWANRIALHFWATRCGVVPERANDSSCFLAASSTERAVAVGNMTRLNHDQFILSIVMWDGTLDLGLNWRALGLLALIGASATALVGLLPAFRSSSVSPGDVLKAGSNRHSTRRGLLRPLVAAQVAFSVTVLFTGGLLLLSFQKLRTLDLGFFRS